MPVRVYSKGMKKAHGFTIVELLIVVVIIAILAAISIALYNNTIQRANAASAQSAAKQAATKLRVAYELNGSYPANLSEAGIQDTNSTYQYTPNNNTSPASFCITATSGNASYFVNTTTAVSPQAGGCSGHGQGGAVAITNLATSPRGTQSFQITAHLIRLLTTLPYQLRQMV